VKEILCIVCPNGCRLRVEENGGELKIAGNRCSRGIDFAKAEITSPMRSVTTTVRTAFPKVPVLPVRTGGEIPKGKILELMQFLDGIVVKKPLGIGETAVENVLGLGIDMLVTSNILKELSP
jgi:CxxC motif-containing protein